METLKLAVILLICVGLIFAIGFAGRNIGEEDQSVFNGPGTCPTCETPFIKGVYGQYSPHFIWYCPNCP